VGAWRISALGRGRASYFCRHKSNQKGCQQKCFCALIAFALQTWQNHGLLNFAATSFAHIPASGKIANALTAAQATIVLPAFVRSRSADGGEEKDI